MSKKTIDNAISTWGDIPNVLRKQVELQRDHYYRLIDIMDQYDWHDLFTVGVKIEEKYGDIQLFVSNIVSPIRLTLFRYDDSDIKPVNTIILPPLLEEKLMSMDIYMGPIGGKYRSKDGDEHQSPFKFMVSKEDRTIRIIYM